MKIPNATRRHLWRFVQARTAIGKDSESKRSKFVCVVLARTRDEAIRKFATQQRDVRKPW